MLSPCNAAKRLHTAHHPPAGCRVLFLLSRQKVGQDCIEQRLRDIITLLQHAGKQVQSQCLYHALVLIAAAAPRQQGSEGTVRRRGAWTTTRYTSCTASSVPCGSSWDICRGDIYTSMASRWPFSCTALWKASMYSYSPDVLDGIEDCTEKVTNEVICLQIQQQDGQLDLHVVTPEAR